MAQPGPSPTAATAKGVRVHGVALRRAKGHPVPLTRLCLTGERALAFTTSTTTTDTTGAPETVALGGVTAVDVVYTPFKGAGVAVECSRLGLATFRVESAALAELESLFVAACPDRLPHPTPPPPSDRAAQEGYATALVLSRPPHRRIPTLLYSTSLMRRVYSRLGRRVYLGLAFVLSVIITLSLVLSMLEQLDRALGGHALSEMLLRVLSPFTLGALLRFWWGLGWLMFLAVTAAAGVFLPATVAALGLAAVASSLTMFSSRLVVTLMMVVIECGKAYGVGRRYLKVLQALLGVVTKAKAEAKARHHSATAAPPPGPAKPKGD